MLELPSECLSVNLVMRPVCVADQGLGGLSNNVADFTLTPLPLHGSMCISTLSEFFYLRNVPVFRRPAAVDNHTKIPNPLTTCDQQARLYA